MKRIFNSNPYIWLLIAIPGAIIQVFSAICLTSFMWLSIPLFIIALIIFYFIVPRYMNFRPVFDIKEECLYLYDRDLNIRWKMISQLEFEDNCIHIDYTDEGDIEQHYALYSSSIFGNLEKLLLEMRKHIIK